MVVDGCTYYSGACYTPVACNAYIIPSAYATDATKRLFC